MASKRAQPESVGAKDRTYAQINPQEDGAEAVHAWWMKAWSPPMTAQSAMPGLTVQPWLKAYGEVASFYQLRLRKDFETLASMSLCRTPHEAGAVWMRAINDAATDYAEAFGKMVDPKQ